MASAQKNANNVAAKYDFRIIPLDKEKSFFKKQGISLELTNIDSIRIPKVLRQTLVALQSID